MSVKKFISCISFVLIVFILPEYSCGQTPEIAKRKLKDMDIYYSEFSFYEAIEDGDEKTVKLFIEAGMDVNLDGKYYGNPLAHACENEEFEVAKLLLKIGANPNSIGRLKETALSIASKKDNFELIKLLIDNNADINFCSRSSALYEACQNENEEIIYYLLNRGANPDIHCGGYGSPLMWAIHHENEELVKALINKGADVNLYVDFGTALTWAVKQESEEIILYLLDCGADVNLGNPIYNAASRGNEDIFNILMNAGADILVEDEYHRTVMHYAQKYRDGRKIIGYLEDLGFEEIEGLYEKDRLDYYFDYFNNGNQTKQALALIREEIIMPSNTTAQNQAALRNHGLLNLVKYINEFGISNELINEAETYYKEGISWATPDYKELAMYIELSMGQFLAWTDPITALNHLNKALEYSKDINSKWGQILCYQSFAMFYDGLGQYDNSRFYFEKAISIGKSYFLFDEYPDDEGQWMQYCNLFQSYWELNANDKNPQEIVESFKYIRPAIEEYQEDYLSVFYHNLTKSLLIAGAHNKAKLLYPIVKEYAEDEKSRSEKIGDYYVTEYDMFLLKGTISLYTGEYAEAIPELELCKRLKDENNYTFDFGLHRSLGLAYEYSDNLDKAINFREELMVKQDIFRKALSSDMRLKIYENKNLREHIEATTRLYIKRYQKFFNNNDLNAAIKYSELLHGRNLYEKISGNYLDASGEFNVDSIQRKLNKDEGIITFTIAEPYIEDIAHIIVIVLTKDYKDTFLIPINYDDFNRNINSIIEKLSNPNSNISELNTELLNVSNILVKPFRSIIEKTKNIYVIPDGNINLIPFELISLSDYEYKPLINQKYVSIFPSIRIFLDQKNKTKSKTESLFAMADPFYGASYFVNQQEVRQSYSQDKKNIYFSNLPETRSEVLEISKLFPEGKVKHLFGPNANESNIKHEFLSNYDIIHIASHGVLGNDLPGIVEPALILSKDMNEDGILLASEAEKLKLDAELTVLSACKTGSGENISGEGLMGIGRSFIIAGSYSVLVSLWSVESKTTELLMVEFYKNLKKGQLKSEALRNAKLFIMNKFNDNQAFANLKNRGVRLITDKTNSMMHPFYWAPFILIGN